MATPRKSSSWRILLVDDEPKILTFLALKLRLCGYEVTSATSGEEALALVRKTNPHLMLLDIVMPGIDGLEVLRRLAATDHLPVIAMSARPETRGEALKLGALDYVAKPFDPDEMVSRVQSVLKA